MDSQEGEQRRAARLERYGDVYRSKGFVYVGSPRRIDFYGVVSQSGNAWSFSQGAVWGSFPVAASNETCKQDPGQLLVFIGQNLKKEVLRADLDVCLLTKSEEKKLRAAVRKSPNGPDVFPDPLPVFKTTMPASYEWDTSLTVTEVKKSLSEASGLDPNHVELWYGNIKLQEEKRIGDYSITPEVPIVLRPKGWK